MPLDPSWLDRRTELKRWGLLLTCFYTRAIHIEILEDMSTDSLIQALHCFMALRGPVKLIFSDNGTNFVGANHELNKQLDRTNDAMKIYLSQNEINFHFNSPDASHQNGVTERLIRSVRAVLNGMALTSSGRLDTKTLRTMFYEATNIVKSQPITATAVENPEDAIITPNLLLTMKSVPLVAPPPGRFSEAEIYSRKRWEASQHMAEEFWLAWRAEYMQHLMIRQKWANKERNVRRGDIVLVADSNLPRNDWRIGRVVEVYPGIEGLVRNVDVKLGNRHLDRHGKALSKPTVLRRSIQKLVILVKSATTP